ncbi:MAG: ribose-phosphate diphosphokinase [Nanoarchaeota archaeon]
MTILFKRSQKNYSIMIIVSLNNSKKLAKSVAKSLNTEYGIIEINSFPDGELHMRYDCDVKNKKVVIVESMQPDPTQALLNSIFASNTAKDLGCRKVIFVTPYIAYMRQDKRFNEGEAINAKIMAKLINENFDKIITIDPHLHRIKKMRDIFKIASKNLTANLEIADFVENKFKNPVIVGPDWESYQWAEVIAKKINVNCTVLEKDRHSYRNVDVEMTKKIDIENKEVIIVDDIISTGNTMIKASKVAKKLKAKKVIAIGVHGLFVENAINKMKKHFDGIYTCDSIVNKNSKISLTNVICKELKKEL